NGDCAKGQLQSGLFRFAKPKDLRGDANSATNVHPDRSCRQEKQLNGQSRIIRPVVAKFDWVRLQIRSFIASRYMYLQRFLYECLL
ncbi:MAG TPA: hypothetical protein VIU13_01435, partial [Chryseolinea sp.]